MRSCNIIRVTGLKKPPTTPLLFLVKDAGKEYEWPLDGDAFVTKGLGQVYAARGANGMMTGMTWAKVRNKTGRPTVKVTLAVLNRRPGNLENLTLKYRMSRAGHVADMVPPLDIELPSEDVALEGTASLKGFSLGPGLQSQLATVSFMPSRKHLEDCVPTPSSILC